MKLLITGGCGFLGSNLAAFYLEGDNQILIVDSLFRKGSELNLKWLSSKSFNNNLDFVKLDIADRESVMEVFAKYGPFDYICHVCAPERRAS